MYSGAWVMSSMILVPCSELTTGRLNPNDATVEPVESVGWDGDALEAQAFAFLAVRAIRGLPLSLPQTTGVSRPLTGGRLHKSS